MNRTRSSGGVSLVEAGLVMAAPVPYFDLRAQARSLGPELQNAVLGVLESGNYVLGEHVEAFERAFAAYCGVRHAVALNSGTSALHLALLAAGVGPGDEVITVSMTFVATAAAILLRRRDPALRRHRSADAGTMDPRLVEAGLTPRTRAIIPVHLHGRMADMAPILEIARRQRPRRDRRCGAGARRDLWRTTGWVASATWGASASTPAKNLGACGEGGALVTDDDVLARRVRSLREWGQQEKYIHAVHGFNFRMDAIQGAVLRVKLPHLEDWTEARRRIAQRYDANLLSIGLRAPQAAPSGEHVYHVYAMRTADRDQVRKQLAEAGIATGIHYPVPVHLQPAYAELGHRPGDFPATESFSEETMSLPIFPEMTMAQVDRVCDVLEQVTRGAHVDGTR